MVPFQLPTGKTVLLTFEELLNMTDADYQNMIANNEGIDIEDPFNKKLDDFDREQDIDLTNLPEIPKELSEDEVKKANGKKA